MKRSRLPFLGALLLLTFVALASPTAAQQQTGSDGTAAGDGVVHSWALVPGDGTQTGGVRSTFTYDLDPGSDVNDVATVYNYSNVPLTFFVYATDAFNGQDGAFSLLPFETKPKDVGSWFNVPRGAAVTIPPGRQATFPFSIHVPADARPGDHVGALLASSAALDTSPEGKTITVDRRTGSRVYVRVAGPLQPRLDVEKLSTSFVPALSPVGGTAKVSYRIVNNGNIRLGLTHRVSVGGPLGFGKKRSPTRKVTELLPGEGLSYSIELDGVPASGLAFTKVDVDPAPVSSGDKDPADSGARTFTFAPPYTVLALLFAALLVWYARRSYRRHRASVGFGGGHVLPGDH